MARKKAPPAQEVSPVPVLQDKDLLVIRASQVKIASLEKQSNILSTRHQEQQQELGKQHTARNNQMVQEIQAAITNIGITPEEFQEKYFLDGDTLTIVEKPKEQAPAAPTPTEEAPAAEPTPKEKVN